MKRILAAALAVMAATPALAHHPLAGAPMETFTHGVLSGVGHPVLGFDHMFFVALIGIAALYTGRRFMAPAAYIAAMLIGTLMMSFGLVLPMVETVIAVSLVVLGYVVLSGRALSMGSAAIVFAGYGLYHASAFGTTIAGQEAAMGAQVLVGYLIGLGVVQYLIALAAGYVVHSVYKATSSMDIQPRLAGAVVAGVGAFLTLEAVEGAAFAALGLG